MGSTKSAWAVPNDQTIGYLAEDGAITVLPSEAHLFDSKEQAASAADEWSEPNGEAEEITDVVAFRARQPTWGDRPVTMATLFEMARGLSAALDNENLRAERFHVRSEAYLLSSAAHVFLKALGHRGADGAWVFGKESVPAESPGLDARATTFAFCGGELLVEERRRLAGVDVEGAAIWVLTLPRRGYLLGVDGQWRSQAEPVRVTRDEALRRAGAIEACWTKLRTSRLPGEVAKEALTRAKGLCPDCGLDGCVVEGK